MTMEHSLTLHPIAYIENDFPTKFGVPRQSGLLDALESFLYPISPYDDPTAYRGIEEYSHLWLLWGFSEVEDTAQRNNHWSPTVRPPRLGGNKRVGVFSTRSPFRPNPVGLSSVRLLAVESPEATGNPSGRLRLRVAGADLMSGTPIYDIKPYLTFTDSHPDAKDGFAANTRGDRLTADLPEHCRGILPPEKEKTLLQILASDPRPAYQDDPERIYGFFFAEYEVRFRVANRIAEVLSIRPANDPKD